METPCSASTSDSTVCNIFGWIFNARAKASLLTHGCGRIEHTWVALTVEQNEALLCQICNTHALALHGRERGSTAIIGSWYKTRDEKVRLCSAVRVRVNPMSISPFSNAASC